MNINHSLFVIKLDVFDLEVLLNLIQLSTYFTKSECQDLFQDCGQRFHYQVVIDIITHLLPQMMDMMFYWMIMNKITRHYNKYMYIFNISILYILYLFVL